MNKNRSLTLFLVHGSILSFFFLLCSEPAKPPEKPRLAPVAGLSVFAGDTTRLTVDLLFAPAMICGYLWSFDGGKNYSDTTITNSLYRSWSAADTGVFMIAVKVYDSRGIVSDSVPFQASVELCKPILSIIADTAVDFIDPCIISVVNSSDCARVRSFIWSFDGGLTFSDTSLTGTITKRWNRSDTGKTCEVVVQAQAETGLFSEPASLKIHIDYCRPVIAINGDSVVDVSAVSRLSLSNPTPCSISHYLWSFNDGAGFTDTTFNPSILRQWRLQDVGIRIVRAAAQTTAGIISPVDTFKITIVAVEPSISAPHDTLVRAKDTVIARVQASSAGGKIVRYLWNIGSLSWTDSSDSPQLNIWRQGKDTVSVLVGARDEHGNLSVDSFHVFFNAPPENLQMLSPRDGDTIFVRSIDSAFARGTVPFKFSVSDRNGISDSLTYKLYLGNILKSLDSVYEGRDSFYSASKLDTARYYWKLVVRDMLGDSAFITGSFTRMLQKTICFAGHSIIVGIGGSLDSGGLRKKVLSTLRSRKGGEAKVKSVGPLPTGFLPEKKDDSCFAVSSYRARDLLTLMRNSFPFLTADTWVVMLGVNDQYSTSELQNLITLLDLIYGNNPLSYTYVINGLPYQTTRYPPDTVFNKWLSDSISVRQTQNRNIWNIDAYRLFSLNNAPDTALFSPVDNPLLHPNQKGYDSLAQMVLDTMSKYEK